MDPHFSMTDAEYYMTEALAEASEAGRAGEVPVGCVIVDPSGKIIARGRNTREKELTVHGHAEINAINGAASKLGRLDLSGCSMFVTLEPCPMCLGAIASSGISAVYFGAEASGAPGFSPGLRISRKDCGFEIFSGIMQEKCESLLKDFFKDLRIL